MAEIFKNHAWLCAVSAWFAAQALKLLISWALHDQLDWHKFVSAGGMPSSHSAMVVALTLSIGIQDGFDSSLFAACFVLAAIVMYDAAGVRRETGRQGQPINQILQSAIFDGRPISNTEMKEIVGHTPLEVFGGFLLGVVCALVWNI